MDLFEAEGFVVGDAAGVGGGDEAEVFEEQDGGFEDVFGLDAADFIEQAFGAREAEVVGEGGGAECGAIVELDGIGRGDGAMEADLLEAEDVGEELRASPGLSDAVGLGERDDVGGGFFNDSEAVEFELTQDGGFTGAGCAGEDVAFDYAPLTCTRWSITGLGALSLLATRLLRWILASCGTSPLTLQRPRSTSL